MDSLHQPKPEEIDPAHDHVDEQEAHVHAVAPWILLSVFGVLLVLTVATVAVTWIDLGRTANVWIALFIAVLKAAFVGLFFMHLYWDSKFNFLVLVASLFFVALFIGITTLDSKEYNVNYQPPPVPAARPME
ncbi:MAG: cytochrome C oxidase subunit IV family protein [Tepidisphaeraceae bacterium]